MSRVFGRPFSFLFSLLFSLSLRFASLPFGTLPSFPLFFSFLFPFLSLSSILPTSTSTCAPPCPNPLLFLHFFLAFLVPCSLFFVLVPAALKTN